MVDVNRAVRVLGCNLLKGLFSRCGSGENLLVSPYAAMVTLSLLTAGAQEDTEQELAEALQVRLPLIHAAMRRTILFPTGGGPTAAQDKLFFRMANRVLVGSALSLNDSYCKIGSRVYGTTVEEVDFADDADGERRRVNEWARNSSGIAGDLLGAECTLAADTGIVLLSAAAVRAASWQQPVTAKLSPFGEVHAALTLETRAVYGYAWLEELSLQAVDVPFSCEAFSATVLLPTGSKSLEDLCDSLTAEVLERVFTAVRSGRRAVRLELPAINAETASDLKPVLLEMGVQQAFEDEAAFQRITSSSPARVSWVLHRARLDIQANDSESAISIVPGQFQAGGGSPLAMARPAASEIQFLVNKPFVLCVRKMDILLLLACIQSVR
ncbi:serpin B3-like [Dermacentor andersoni]|uniref:serpin B3-like n=1 Tax=Dermacentor andersoni TaxID=34620 RepID=UPI002154FC98|nr:serpin B3-like [Dermacentor andersoni]